MTIDDKDNDLSSLRHEHGDDGDDSGDPGGARPEALEDLFQGAGPAFVTDLRALLREEWEGTAPLPAEDELSAMADRVRESALDTMRRSVAETRREQSGVTDLGSWRRARGDPKALRAVAGEKEPGAARPPEDQEQCVSPDGRYRIVYVPSADAVFLVPIGADTPPLERLQMGERSIALGPADASGRQKLLDTRLGNLPKDNRPIQLPAEDDP